MEEEEQQQQLPLAKTLWILTCDVGYANQLFSFYASSQEEAETRAQVLLQQQGKRILHRLSLIEYPNGFVVHHWRIPGTRQE